MLEKLVVVNATNTSPTCRDMNIIQKDFLKKGFVVTCLHDYIFSADDLIGNAFTVVVINVVVVSLLLP